MRTRVRFLIASLAVASFASSATSARAQTPAESPTGPAADIKPLVAAPKDPADAPSFAKPTDGSSATLSAGALMQTGNSYMLAATANGAYDRHFGDNGVGAALIANYGESRPTGGSNQATTENIQGKLRYDRYLTDNLTAFLMGTGRSDRFQGVEFRLNIDPGVKYLFVNQPTTAFWGEAGYDFQYTVNRDDARQDVDSTGKLEFNADGSPKLEDKTVTDHSARLFAGFKYAFNSDVTTKFGLEYLQSVIDSGRYRVNFDALIAAKLRGGLAMGVGFSARYDHAPLPGKEELDTSTSLNLIYSFANPAPKKDNCPCDLPPEGPPAGPPPPPPPPPAPVGVFAPPPTAAAPPPALNGFAK